MAMIDFHTHILPSVDDGSSDLEISLNMLKCLQEQSINTVVLTPHYYSHTEPIDKFLLRREKASRLLTRATQDMSIELRFGAEVYFSEYLFNNKDLSALCVDGTNTMLVELPFSQNIDARMLSRLERLCYEYAIVPVLAHIERYPQLMKSSKMIEALLEMGCVFQTNVSSYTAFGKRKLLSLAKKGYIGALGTDAHNLITRKPNYQDGYRYLQKHLSEENLRYIQDTMEWLLERK